jgi:hypothetical protein
MIYQNQGPNVSNVNMMIFKLWFILVYLIYLLWFIGYNYDVMDLICLDTVSRLHRSDGGSNISLIEYADLTDAMF